MFIEHLLVSGTVLGCRNIAGLRIYSLTLRIYSLALHLPTVFGEDSEQSINVDINVKCQVRG